MGQAFDRDNAVLGEAEGQTKREVFEKLIDKFPDADRIEIKSRPSDAPVTPTLAAELTGEPMLRFFDYAHLPEKLQLASAPFASVAIHVAHTLERSAERTACLRKLLEAKDCAVRATL